MAKVLTALEVLKKHRWLDLTHEVNNSIPYFQAFQPLAERTLFTVEGDGFLAKEYKIVSQYGTHIDAPVHFASGKRILTDLSLKELFLPLYVIHKEAEVAENPDYSISVADILEFEAAYGKIPADSFVAFASGWSQRWDKAADFYNLDETGISHTPGWSLAALKFLHEERNITAIGHETLDTDAGADYAKNKGLVAELYWLSQNKYQVEVLNNLKELPAVGAIIQIGVPKIAEAPGFTVRAVAILPELA
ncbi:cyclase family protein [Enterococcus sp. HY326]|uniref:cyclase family protein n=1 Tax=Enterococcus sp. HY326 TaxID=2971265 RepID=UPI00223F41CB|nr:cyclase family protein [Enterococcus sp. HY326]